MNIFVGNLNYNITEDDLREIFEEYGELSSVKLISDKFTGKSKGFGFVEMADADEAKKAIEELNGAEVEGRTMVVNESIEKKREPRDNNRRGGGGFNRGGNGGGFNRGGNSGGGYGRRDNNFRSNY
ncbi:RNA recognition motif domain-containing protein [Mangrovibacterium diazotrophicum]|uniref:RNA recognition motif-containing protein n=1 Tax=Mangrovibacterium diazotrophicum TaxID=1261403 RepID=A0A419VVG3_9BACT|nr:RNA-binding protein [Mangrovibacterium diazotrophicum]RKD86149.1 RNA recognition motif-containing protein [Mangrovibacterium diazotrophicum]